MLWHLRWVATGSFQVSVQGVARNGPGHHIWETARRWNLKRRDSSRHPLCSEGSWPMTPGPALSPAVAHETLGTAGLLRLGGYLLEAADQPASAGRWQLRCAGCPKVLHVLDPRGSVVAHAVDCGDLGSRPGDDRRPVASDLVGTHVEGRHPGERRHWPSVKPTAGHAPSRPTRRTAFPVTESKRWTGVPSSTGSSPISTSSRCAR